MSKQMTELAAVGARLRAAGLTERALAAWTGTSRISALPARLAALTAEPATPAAAILALLVGGAELTQGQLRGVTGDLLDALLAHRLVERGGDRGRSIDRRGAAPRHPGPRESPGDDRLRAALAIVPLGRSLLVCDRLDAPVERDLVCWPDDSSHHLATAIPPGRRASWLDLGCGSAFAPLARPELARRIHGVDLNPRAVRCAELGAALSGIAHLRCEAGDAGAPHEPAELVTCNAPMPEGPAPLSRALPELWRHAEPGFFARLWPALARAACPGGMIVVHAAREAILPALAGAPGERVIVAYTPPGPTGFAILWWRPDAPARLVAVHRALTADRPHLEPRDRDDALAA